MQQEILAKIIIETLETEPGKRPNDFAKQLGLHDSSVLRVLPYMERTGQLLYEDDRGRLYVFTG